MSSKQILFEIAKQVIIPGSWLPFLDYEKFVFHGQVFNLLWRHAGEVVELPPTIQKLQRLLPIRGRGLIKGWLKPSEEELAATKQIAFVREPISRLSSMYWHSRTGHYDSKWRKRFVRDFGNSSLAECVADSKCVEDNDLRRWCSLQTEVFCGVQQGCRRPLNETSLEIAKKNMKEAFAFVGITEHFRDSLKVLAQVFPAHFQGIDGVAELPHLKKNSYEPSLDKQQLLDMPALQDLCRLDIELYRFAVELFQERKAACSV